MYTVQVAEGAYKCFLSGKYAHDTHASVLHVFTSFTFCNTSHAMEPSIPCKMNRLVQENLDLNRTLFFHVNSFDTCIAIFKQTTSLPPTLLSER